MKNIVIKRKSLIVIIALAVCFLISTICCFVKKDVRRVFIFESIDNSNEYIEVRYLPRRKNIEESVRDFVDDLLLGPMEDRNKLLFPEHTKVEACFVRDGALYLDLSKEAIMGSEKASDIKNAYELLKKNLKVNFKGIKKYEIFMMGNEIYTQN